MSLDKAIEAVLEDMTLPDDAEERALWRGRTVHILQVALPHLEAHFREVMAQRLEAAKPPRNGTGARKIRVDAWEECARFLRESDR